MHYSRYTTMVVALLSTVWGAVVQAATLPVLDQHGNALEDAVILVEGVAQRPLPSSSMDQIDLQFQPHVLVVPTGTQVGFPNSDNVRHHVYSFSAAKPFELRLFHGSEAPPVTFEEPGAVVLGCNIHDAMIGYILVTDSPWYGISSPQGILDLAYLPPGEAVVSWWHPTLGDAPPVTLGSIDLHASDTLTLAVDGMVDAAAEKPLSPLQKRFNKAAGKYAN